MFPHNKSKLFCRKICLPECLGKDGRLKKIAYANGDYARLGYDRYGNMISEKWFDENGLLTYEYVYSYDNEGNIVKTIDKASLKEYNYTYDEGNLIRATEYDVTIENDVVTSKSIVVGIVYLYNHEGEVVKKKAVYPDGTITGNAPSKYEVEEKEIDGSEFTITPSMEDEDTPYDYVVTTTDTDELGRKLSDSVGKTADDIVRSFTYVEGLAPTELGGYNDHVLSQNEVDLAKQKYKPTTQLVKDITVTDKKGDQIHTFYYEYDGEERIKKLVETYTVNGEAVTDTTLYSYDDLGQLLTETKNGTVINSMTYDGYGNILTKNGTAYRYGDNVWRDKLTAIGSSSINYDAQGNPTTYRGKSLVWEKGRQLKSYDGITYTYNANGIRTSKTVGGVKHTYVLDGTKILKETWGTNTIIPLYDNEDNVCGVCYNCKSYYFVKNLQGDVVSLVTKEEVNGEVVYTVVANYSYDAWGKCTIVFDSTDVSIATINPYRYRGYYYDAETGLYYVSSRYYDPAIGRWINSDEAEYVKIAFKGNSTNSFAYCQSDPVNDIDIRGEASKKSVLHYFKKTLEAFSCLFEFLMDGASMLIGLKEKISWKSISKIAKAVKRSPDRIRQYFNWLSQKLKGFRTKLGKIVKALSFIAFFSSIMGVLKEKTEFIKEVSSYVIGAIFDGLSSLVCWLATGGIKLLSRFFPILGGLFGFVLGSIAGKFIDDFFESRSKRMSEKYTTMVNFYRFKPGDYITAFIKCL